MNPPSLDSFAWPASRLGGLLELLARQSGLAPKSNDLPPPPSATNHGSDLDSWIQGAADFLGVEAELVETNYGEVAKFLFGAAPALLRAPGGSAPGYLGLLGASGDTVTLLAPDLSRQRVGTEFLRTALCQGMEAPLVGDLDRVLADAGVQGRSQAKARAAILREQLHHQPLSAGWILRASPGSSIWGQARRVRLIRRAVVLAAAHLIQYVLWLLSWWMIGLGAMQGRLDAGWLLAWALLLLAIVPVRLLETWTQGTVAILAGGLLKQRLLQGALRLAPEETRHQGVGQLLGRVLESEVVESLALSGGFLGLFAVVELVIAGVVIGLGAGGWVQVILLLIWLAAAARIGWSYFKARQRWTADRLTMTNDLVERMVGHRTRLAQETSERWHHGEDQSIERYLGLSEAMDRKAARLIALVPRGWLVVGLLGLIWPFTFQSHALTALAVGLGGTLLAYRALQKLAAGLWCVADAVISWQQIAPLFHAAARPILAGMPGAIARTGKPMGGLDVQQIDAPRDDEPRVSVLHCASPLALFDGPDASESARGLAQSKTSRPPSAMQTPLLEVRDVTYRYRDRGNPVLRGCELRILAGDRLLLEGASGGGKSTFASVLAGLRSPDSGLLLLGGLDPQTIGEREWRRRIAAAPQFHENHVVTGTLLFNLLLGRGWPPSPEDMPQVEMLCRELGLDGVVSRMPGGLLQMVGDTGWQLSQGEKSRLYIARALLQGADLILLDESFAALDPENLQRALRCVLERAKTVLVVAHP